MNKYLIDLKIGFIEHQRRDVIEAKNLKDALDFALVRAQAAYPSDEIISIDARRLWCPCPYCFSEQMECVGCTNINCPSKRK